MRSEGLPDLGDEGVMEGVDDLIAKVTGQPTEWVVPRGCAD